MSLVSECVGSVLFLFAVPLTVIFCSNLFVTLTLNWQIGHADLEWVPSNWLNTFVCFFNHPKFCQKIKLEKQGKCSGVDQDVCLQFCQFPVVLSGPCGTAGTHLRTGIQCSVLPNRKGRVHSGPGQAEKGWRQVSGKQDKATVRCRCPRANVSCPGLCAVAWFSRCKTNSRISFADTSGKFLKVVTFVSIRRKAHENMPFQSEAQNAGLDNTTSKFSFDEFSVFSFVPRKFRRWPGSNRRRD